MDQGFWPTFQTTKTKEDFNTGKLARDLGVNHYSWSAKLVAFIDEKSTTLLNESERDRCELTILKTQHSENHHKWRDFSILLLDR